MFLKNNYKNLIGVGIIFGGIIISIFILYYNLKIGIAVDECISRETCENHNPNCPEKYSVGCRTPAGCSAPLYPDCDNLHQANIYQRCFLNQCQTFAGNLESDCNECLGIKLGITSNIERSETETNEGTIINQTTTIDIFQENCCTRRDLIPPGAVIAEGHTCNTDAACWKCPAGTYLDPSGLAGCKEHAKCLPQSKVNDYLGVNQTGIWANSPPYKSSTEGCPEGTATLECNEGYYWGSAEAYDKVVDKDGMVGWGDTNQTWYSGLRCLPNKNNTTTGCASNPSICPAIFGQEYTYECVNNLCTVIITTTSQQFIGRSSHSECINNTCRLVMGDGENQCVIGEPCGDRSNPIIDDYKPILPGDINRPGDSNGRGDNNRPIIPRDNIIPGNNNQNGGGVNEYHFECNSSNQCVSVPGSGDNRCSTDSDCGKDGAKFKGVCDHQRGVCINQACQSNEDCTSSCKTDADCPNPTNPTSQSHLECYNNACVIVSGPGQNKCGTIGQGCRRIREIIPFNPPSLNQFIKQTALIIFGWR